MEKKIKIIVSGRTSNDDCDNLFRFTSTEPLLVSYAIGLFRKFFYRRAREFMLHFFWDQWIEWMNQRWNLMRPCAHTIKTKNWIAKNSIIKLELVTVKVDIFLWKRKEEEILNAEKMRPIIIIIGMKTKQNSHCSTFCYFKIKSHIKISQQ